MYARSTTIQGQPSSIDAGIAHTRDSAMPALEGIDGCVGLSLLVDRTSGRCIVTTSWESEEAMRASEESIRPIRDRAAELLGGSRQVEEWEIAGAVVCARTGAARARGGHRLPALESTTDVAVGRMGGLGPIRV